jgi:hypothetical protein
MKLQALFLSAALTIVALPAFAADPAPTPAPNADQAKKEAPAAKADEKKADDKDNKEATVPKDAPKAPVPTPTPTK